MKGLLARDNLELAGWMAIILVMLASGYYRLYLVSWQAYSLGATLALLLLLALVGAAAERGKPQEPPPAWVEVAAHFLPLFVFLVMGPTTLGRQAASVGDPLATTGRPTEAAPISAPRTDDGYYQVNLLQLYTNQRFYEEPVPVQVVGMLYFLQPEDEKNLPRGVRPEEVHNLLFRYVIVCCVADARQATVVLKGADFSRFEAGDWLEVKGKTKPPSGALQIITIEVDDVRKVPQPANPYIY